MAFTFQSYIADPTLVMQGEFSEFIADPTLVMQGEFSEFIADPTLVMNGEFAKFIADGSLLAIGPKLPTFVSDPTLTAVVTPLPVFVADPTLVMNGEFAEFIADTPAGLPGAYKTLEQMSKSMAGVAGAVATASKTLQQLTKTMTAIQITPKQLEKFQKAMTGHTGVVTTGLNFPKRMQYLVKEMHSDPYGTKAITQTAWRKSAAGSPGSLGSFNKVVSRFTAVKVGTLGAAGTKAITLTEWSKSAEGSLGSIGSFSKTFGRFTATKVGVLSVAGTFNKSWQFITRDVQGVVGSVGTTAKSFELLTSTKGGYVQVTGQTAKTLRLFSKGMTGIVVGSTEYTISMHTGRLAPTTYTNYAFNSFAELDGVMMGANANGLFALTGETDDTAEIASTVRVGITDFGTSKLKRIDTAYVGYRTDGSLTLTTLTDEVNSNDYTLAPIGKTGIHPVRVLIGKGLCARYWQFEVKNVAGANFEIDSIELKPTQTSRRVGGSYA